MCFYFELSGLGIRALPVSCPNQLCCAIMTKDVLETCRLLPLGGITTDLVKAAKASQSKGYMFGV
eukprot:6021943-Amphidinium_carterae.2